MTLNDPKVAPKRPLVIRYFYKIIKICWENEYFRKRTFIYLKWRRNGSDEVPKAPKYAKSAPKVTPKDPKVPPNELLGHTFRFVSRLTNFVSRLTKFVSRFWSPLNPALGPMGFQNELILHTWAHPYHDFDCIRTTLGSLWALFRKHSFSQWILII